MRFIGIVNEENFAVEDISVHITFTAMYKGTLAFQSAAKVLCNSSFWQ